jgi:hypothetical protein
MKDERYQQNKRFRGIVTKNNQKEINICFIKVKLSSNIALI